MQECPDSRIQSTSHPFTRNGLKTATAFDVGLALAHAAIKMPATERTDSVYGASLVHVQCDLKQKMAQNAAYASSSRTPTYASSEEQKADLLS